MEDEQCDKTILVIPMILPYPVFMIYSRPNEHSKAQKRAACLSYNSHTTPSTPCLSPTMTPEPNNANIKLQDQLLSKVQIIAQPATRIDTRDIQTRSTVGQRRKEPESVDCGTKNNQSSDPSCDDGLLAHAL